MPGWCVLLLVTERIILLLGEMILFNISHVTHIGGKYVGNTVINWYLRKCFLWTTADRDASHAWTES